MADEKTDQEKNQEKAVRLVKKIQKNGLEARVKANYALGTNIIAFSGLEFTKKEWRQVPAGRENEALVHPYLDLRDAETQEEIEISSKEVIAAANPTSLANLVQMQEPEQVEDPLAGHPIAKREVEPVGDTAVPEVREAKEEAKEDADKIAKRKRK